VSIVNGENIDFARRLRRVASTAKQSVQRFATLFGAEGLVARRYRGTPQGASAPFELVYVGREAYARELEVYFRRDDVEKIRPCATLFEGSLAKWTMERKRVARESECADFVACEVFPGAHDFHDDDALHHPMLDAQLRVESSIAEQIRRVRSRAQRRAMRELLASNRYETWVDSSTNAFETFYTTLHEPYVRERFGDWGASADPHTMRRLFERAGAILFVADRAQPHEPVCGTLLLDEGGGTLAYQLNGFAGPAALVAERTNALELALFQYALDRRFSTIDLGYTRAMLDDGLFTHKRRLGCSFTPTRSAPVFRVRARPGKRAATYARFPLLVGTPGAWTALLGFDGASPTQTKQRWHAMLKNYRVPELRKAIVWTSAEPAAGEAIFREAIAETLDLPDGVELRRDGGGT
jgi:hypothetical protein